MRPGLEPSAVGLLRLLSERKRDSEASVVDFLDFPDQALDPVDEGRIAAFAALQGHGPVSQFVGQAGAIKDFLVAEAVALHPLVPAPQPAIEAVLLADIAELDEPPQMDIIVQVLKFDLQPALEKTFLFSPFRRQEDLDFLQAQVLLAEYVVKCRNHRVRPFGNNSQR